MRKIWAFYLILAVGDDGVEVGLQLLTITPESVPSGASTAVAAAPVETEQSVRRRPYLVHSALPTLDQLSSYLNEE
jgi:hypothetical protein